MIGCWRCWCCLWGSEFLLWRRVISNASRGCCCWHGQGIVCFEEGIERELSKITGGFWSRPNGSGRTFFAETDAASFCCLWHWGTTIDICCNQLRVYMGMDMCVCRKEVKRGSLYKRDVSGLSGQTEILSLWLPLITTTITTIKLSHHQFFRCHYVLFIPTPYCIGLFFTLLLRIPFVVFIPFLSFSLAHPKSGTNLVDSCVSHNATERLNLLWYEILRFVDRTTFILAAIVYKCLFFLCCWWHPSINIWNASVDYLVPSSLLPQQPPKKRRYTEQGSGTFMIKEWEWGCWQRRCTG